MSNIKIDREKEGYRLAASQLISAPPAKVFKFFADASNLETLTPPSLKFEILTPLPIEMEVGTRIEYRLKIRGIPFAWTTLITAWEPPFKFVDRQLKGPYREWIHEHVFHAEKGGTRVEDRVHYQVPGGRLVHALVVRRDVKSIFEFRQDKLREIFSP